MQYKPLHRAERRSLRQAAAYIYIYIYICMYNYMYANIIIYVYMYTHNIYIYIYTSLSLSIYIYMYICIHTQGLPSRHQAAEHPAGRERSREDGHLQHRDVLYRDLAINHQYRTSYWVLGSPTICFGYWVWITNTEHRIDYKSQSLYWILGSGSPTICLFKQAPRYHPLATHF